MVKPLVVAAANEAGRVHLGLGGFTRTPTLNVVPKPWALEGVTCLGGRTKKDFKTIERNENGKVIRTKKMHKRELLEKENVVRERTVNRRTFGRFVCYAQASALEADGGNRSEWIDATVKRMRKVTNEKYIYIYI